MGRSKRRKKASGTKKGNYQPKKVAKSKNKITFLALGVVAVALGVAGYLILGGTSEDVRSASREITPEKGKDIKRDVYLREKRETLSPDLFRGKVRAAYRIAKEIPEVLDKLYCYCKCRENFGHKNLLTCYVDKHAAG